MVGRWRLVVADLSCFPARARIALTCGGCVTPISASAASSATSRRNPSMRAAVKALVYAASDLPRRSSHAVTSWTVHSASGLRCACPPSLRACVHSFKSRSLQEVSTLLSPHSKEDATLALAMPTRISSGERARRAALIISSTDVVAIGGSSIAPASTCSNSGWILTGSRSSGTTARGAPMPPMARTCMSLNSSCVSSACSIALVTSTTATFARDSASHRSTARAGDPATLSAWSNHARPFVASTLANARASPTANARSLYPAKRAFVR
mmetsp:Transcript_29100/g.95005  ORF Transcript_29100/g.95005 Transcript_29100/m.95005 type:complete len:269 (-) Transcript_29100:345-1151(-)